MLDRIKRLGSDTAVYGVSTILGRFLTFLLTPIYTHILVPGDLGIVAMVYAYIAVLNVVYGYGMEGAYMKYVSTLEYGDRKQVFSVPFLAVGLSSFILSAMLALTAAPVADLIAVPAECADLVAASAAILFLDAVALIPFASLRMARQARRFAGIKLIGIVANVGTNIAFLFIWKMGIRGIFLSNIVSSALVVALLLPTIARQLEIRWHRDLFRALLTFGLPSVPAGFASMLVQVVNRPILEALQGKAAVGIFQANFRLGIFMMLIVSMFDFAWRPFLLSHATDADAKSLFARVLTYFVLLMSGVFLVLSFFLPAVVTAPIFFGHPLVASPYWSGLSIIPVILLAYMALGVYNNLMAGVYIEKKTSFLPIATGAGAAVTIAGSYALIPKLGFMGAAVATLLSYLTMAGVLYVAVQRWYPVHYEWGRIGKILVSAAAVYGLSLVLPDGPAGLLVKGVLLVLFVILMYLLRFFAPSERQAIASFLRRNSRRDDASTPPADDAS